MALQESLVLVPLSCLCIALAMSPYLLLGTNGEEENHHMMRQGQQLLDWEELTSPGGFFKFGFFSRTFDSGDNETQSYTYRYLGIWYAADSPDKPVWVGNRENPIPDSSGSVTMGVDGILRLSYHGGQPINISSSTIQASSSNDITATLLDSGNLMVQQVYNNSNGSSSSSLQGRVLWQSFDYPTDKLLPGMKLGMNLKTGQKWFLTSWLSDQVPAQGAFKLGVDLNDSSGSPQIQLVVWRRDHAYWTSGPWINGSFANVFGPTELEFKFVTNENEKYLSYFYKSNYTSPALTLGLEGEITMTTSHVIWILSTPCDQNEYINMDAVCLKQDFSRCRNGSEMFELTTGYFQIDHETWGDDDMSLALSDCRGLCWNNCSCVMYKSMFPNGTGCKFWENMEDFVPQGPRETFYLLNTTLADILKAQRTDAMAPADLLLVGEAPAEYPGKGSMGEPIKNNSPESMKDWWWWWIWSLMAIIPALAMLFLGVLCHLRKRNLNRKQRTEERERNQEKSLVALTSQTTPSSYKYGGGGADRDKLKINTTRKGQHLQLYSFLQIAAATDNFSSANKLGQGGFGPVYKGVLPAGQHVAVKRLSRTSGQGLVEFKNEITLIAELQHMNLVKLLGCCIQGEEKLLIYEYMPNKSLDFFLFDPTKSNLLDWKRRLNIIEGIAQGLLYLHKYSRMRVIHRDLKASNILLDDQMNPKISDFGLARIFGQDESEANTKRIVGTYGYMSPEYAMNGIFSVKSDVYSFGVLLLEIVSGKKNTSFFRLSGPLSLIEHTWDLWKKGISLELMDPSLDFSCPKTQLLRCIHAGLLCVQECAADRPTMSDIIIMLTNETMCLPEPKQPAFHTGRSQNAATLPAENKSENYSINRVTTSVLEAR